MCHNDRGPAGKFAAQGCAGCHVDPHAGQMGRSCKDCHDEFSWQPKQIIARHMQTRFPLLGAHAAVACFQCHPGAQLANFKGADPTCVNCHQKDLARAISPDHQAMKWTSDCQRCHTPTNWKQANFNHPASFPLTAGHSGLSCSQCHTNGTFKGLSTQCGSCHLPDYIKTTDPKHSAVGFSLQCAQCHSTSSWAGAKFNHTPLFPLTAGHAGVACSQCHKGGVYGPMSTACVSCHLVDYQKTTKPNHAAAGFDTNCITCHTTAGWKGAKFNHPSAFPLTNGHAGLSCTDCHKGGVYTGLSTACASCHLADFQKTTNPNHASSGFSTDCKTCHTTQTWAGAVFNHTAFPISSGAHKLACNQCHLNPSNQAEFSCINCHTHAKAATDSHHSEVRGYTYTSPACYQCHPRGRTG
jgi:hypothetical protein